jgi:hypothetical protein
MAALTDLPSYAMSALIPADLIAPDNSTTLVIASCPTGRAVIRMQEEEHVNEPTNDPEVEAVIE